MIPHSTGNASTGRAPEVKPHVSTPFFPVIPPQRPGAMPVMPGMEQVAEASITKTTNLWAYPINTLYKRVASPPRREKPSISTLIIRNADEYAPLTTRAHTREIQQTNGTTHGLIGAKKMMEKQITGLVPDRGKKIRCNNPKPAWNT